jgi:thymidine phosphorylase
MREGTLFWVVGASGVGKDTLLNGARAVLAADSRFIFAQRVITRADTTGAEGHRFVPEPEFCKLRDAGHFLVDWSAHGLHYGLPRELAGDLKAGCNVVANGSRAAVSAIAGRVANLIVVEITAAPERIAARLRARGREDRREITARLERATPPFPNGVEALQIANDSDLDSGIAKLVSALTLYSTPPLKVRALAIDTWRDHVAYLSPRSTAVAALDYLGPGRIDIVGAARSVRAAVHVFDDPELLQAEEIGLSRSTFDSLGLLEGAPVRIQRTPSPSSARMLRAKIQGDELDVGQYRTLIGDIVEGRYPDREVAAFLVAATRSLSEAEVLALAQARLDFAEQLSWDEPIVVDKHSIGGIPGSRITMIVVPIVAAHGLAMPKTSSRAITSAAGTADAMETLARVDLTVDEVRHVVGQARGCIAWNGRLNHSAVDDVMNAITRPLGIDSNKWSVASILSKKRAAGATHVIIDLPYGAPAKLKTQQEAEDLARLFGAVGRGLGLVVEAHATKGDAPIGRGIGPALEVRDVLWVLENDARAPADLREKALFFASRILRWDPALASDDRARQRAEALLASGAARSALDRIVAAQGRRVPSLAPGAVTRAVRAQRSGTIAGVDGWVVAGIARRAGAPNDRGAGLDLLVQAGDVVREGDPLYIIHANSPADLENAAVLAERTCGLAIAE